MTDQQLYIKIDQEVKDANKQLDMLIGQEKEKMNVLSEQFGVGSVDEMLKKIDDMTAELDGLDTQWDDLFRKLKEAHDWESL